MMRITVKCALNPSSNQVQLVTCSPSEDLDEFIINQCIEAWSLEPPASDYNLRFDSDLLVHKDNLNTITDGSKLKLTFSIDKMVDNILDNLDRHGFSGADVLLHQLSSRDSDFLHCLIDENDGIDVIIKRLLYDLDTHEDSKMINFLLEALCLILDQIGNQALILDKIEKQQNLVSFLAKSLAVNHHDQARIKQVSIFLTVIQKSQPLCQTVGGAIDVNKVLQIVLSTELGITARNSALALFNEIVINADEPNRDQLIRTMEQNNLALQLGREFLSLNSGSVSTMLRKQLYYVQCWSLYHYQKLMKTSVDSQDQKAVSMIRDLRTIAFKIGNSMPGVGTIKRARFAEDYKTLGFISTVDPTQDFQKPPGLLALTLMHGFANNNQALFNKLIMESSCRQNDGCPFAQVSIGLVKVLCDVFNVDQDPKIQTTLRSPVYPFIFTRNDDFLQGIYNASIQHLFETWRQMRASVSNANDVARVMGVTKDQILWSLNQEPTSIDTFGENLPTYAKIQDAWKEGNKRRSNDDCEAIRVLKEVIKPDIMSLIHEQRLNYICEGSLFTKQKKSGSKWMFVKLSANKKTLCYDDWTDKHAVPEIEQLKGKLAICDIKDFLIGDQIDLNASTNAKDNRRPQPNTDKYITIMAENIQLELIADKDDKCFHYWCDALNSLIGREMKSVKVEQDLALLLDTEVDLRLLDLEGVKLPDQAPMIPPLPPMVPMNIF